MSWIDKLLPPKMNRADGGHKKSVPEGIWVKCPACEATLYAVDLSNNAQVCPKCGHHHRIGARERLDRLLDAQGRFEIGPEVRALDSLKFKDSRKYPERLKEAIEVTGETDALVVMQGAIRTVPVIAAAFEFGFMGGSMGAVVGERFVRGVDCAVEQKLPFICFTASGGARMPQEQQIALRDYGMNLGISFQLADDVLDFIAEEEILGKAAGADLLEGKLTLPLILLVKKEPVIKKDIERIMHDGDYSNISREVLLERLEIAETIEETRRRAFGFAEKARKNLEVLTKTEYRLGLEDIPGYMIDRNK